MRRFLILLTLAVPAVAAARSEVTRPLSGADCPAAQPGFAGILTSVAEMIGLAKGCIPADDPGRPRAEAAEWQHMQDVYDA